MNGTHLQIGYAIQSVYLKNKGIFINHIFEKIPNDLIISISHQLRCDYKNFEQYWKIKNIKTHHFQEILDIFGYIKFKYTSNLEKEFYRIAFSSGAPSVIAKEVLKLLKDKKIIELLLPMIEHLV